MKTPIEMVMEYIHDEIMFDKINGLPKNQSLYELLKDCKNLIEEEKSQIKLAYDTGNNDYANYHYYAENAEDYYNVKYNKQ
jgi:hypothetical protein